MAAYIEDVTRCPSCDISGSEWISHYGYICYCGACDFNFCEICMVAVEENEVGYLECEVCGELG